MKHQMMRNFLMKTQKTSYSRSINALSSSSSSSSPSPYSSSSDSLKLSLEQQKSKANEWAKSDEGKRLISQNIKCLLSNQPKNHIIAKDIQSYMISRGLYLKYENSATDDKNLAPTSTSDVNNEKVNQINSQLKKLMSEMSTFLSKQDMSKVIEIEKRINELELEKKNLPQNNLTQNNFNSSSSFLSM